MATHRLSPCTARPTCRSPTRPGVARCAERSPPSPIGRASYTWVANTVAVVTDGTAVLGLGNIGPAAAMPVMEGKAVLFKQFGGIDAVPICLDCTDTDELVDTIARLAPSFGGINLEDISAPRCFEIERRLQERLDIPVFHDDQHGTAIVVLAALRNALTSGRQASRDQPGSSSRAPAPPASPSRECCWLGGRARRSGSSTAGDLADRDAHGPQPGEGRAGPDTIATGLNGPMATALVGADVFIGLSGGHIDETGGRVDGRRRDHLRARQPDARGRPRQSRPACAGRGDRPLGLPKPDQQRARVPGRLPGAFDAGAARSPRR